MFVGRRIARRTARRVSRRMIRRIALAEADAVRIEQETKQRAEDLTEEQLLAAMKKLGIQKLESDDR